jgi:hypothetical protein
VPSFHRGDNFFWILCQPERSWIQVGLGQEAIDRGLKVDKRAKHPQFDPLLRELGEKPFDGIQPGGRCRREVEALPWVPRQPRLDLGVLVGGVVVDDGVDRFALRHGGFGDIEEADERLMPMTLHAAPNHRAVQHAKDREQRGRTFRPRSIGSLSRL